MAEELDLGLQQLGQMARGAATDFANLANVVRAFGSANPLKQHFVVTLKQARELLKGAGGDVDRVKAALKGAGVSGRDTSMLLRQLSGDIDKMRRAAMGFDTVWQRIFSPRTLAYAAHAMQTVTGGFSILKTAMGGPLGMASGIIGKGIDVGKGLLDSVVEAAEFRQNAMSGLAHMLGGGDEGAKAAARVFENAQKLAAQTPLDTDKVIQGVKTFVTQGFSEDQSMFLYKVVADQASKFLDQPEMEKNVVQAFSRMQGRGFATSEDLESLRIAGFRGSEVMRSLMNQPGMRELMTGKNKLTGKETEEEYFKKMRNVLGTGMVGKGTMLNAAIGSLYSGQKLEDEDKGAGALAKKFGGSSLTGAISNAKNAFGDMLKSIDLVNTGGFKALIKTLGDYSSVLTTAEGPGAKLRQTITGLTDAIFGGLGKLTPKDFERIIEVIARMGQGLISFFKKAWEWLDKLMHAEPGEFLSAVGDVLVDVGKFVGKGIWEGVKGAANPFDTTDATDFVKKYGASESTLRELAGKHGVSDDAGFKSFLGRYAEQEKVFREEGQGKYVSQRKGLLFGGETVGEAYSRSVAEYAAREGKGLAADVPKFGDGGYVNQPTLAVVGERGGEYIVPEGKMGQGGGLNITVPIQLMYSGGADEDSLQAALEPVAMRVFTNVFQRLAMEVG